MMTTARHLIHTLTKEPRFILLGQRSCWYCTVGQKWSDQVWTEKIDQKLELRALKQNGVVQHARPLLVLFGWMLAKRKHIQKYEQFYLNRGFNVLTVTGAPMDIIIPRRAQGITRKILEHIEDWSRDVGNQPIVLHGFSVGGYLIGELQVKINTEQTTVSDLIVAQVVDSPVDFDGIPEGFANVLAKNAVLRFFIRNTLRLYMALFKGNVYHYRMSSKTFKDNKNNIPSLFLYSNADPVGDGKRIEGVIEAFHKRDIPVWSKCWDDSPHVGHYHYYPEEYVDTLTSFLDTYCPAQGPTIPDQWDDHQAEGEGRRQQQMRV